MAGIAAALVLTPSLAFAQHDQHNMPASPGWTWTVDARVFLNANLQERKFRDFHVLESQNWLMLGATATTHRVRLILHAMFSLEPFTFHRSGSPQVFQTGESLGGASLVDYQHPHDLLMGATARLEWPVSSFKGLTGPTGTWRLHAEGGPVGAPALGPEPFMHRASAEANPTAPLSHHALDSTHITHGVVTAGLTGHGVTMEASAFRGREPDEHRVRVDLGALDSYSARVSYRTGNWQLQGSAAHITFPDATEFTDVDRVTASLAYSGELRHRALSALVAFGRNRESGVGVTEPALLGEATWHVQPRALVYGRVELLDKDILTRGGYDPPGFVHPHVVSRIGALTLGYERALANAHGRWAAGADATVYARDANLADNYGRPFSAHVFLSYRK